MNVFSCEPCKETFDCIKAYEGHLQSGKHKKPVAEPTSIVPDFKNFDFSSDWKQEPFIRTFQEPCTGTRYECTICNTFLNSVDQVRTHIRGAKHLKVKGTLGFTKLHEFSSGNRSIYQVDDNSPSSSHMGDSPSKFNKHIDKVISSDWEQEPFIIIVGKEYKCTICKTCLNSVDQVRTHIRGAKHLKVKGTLDFTKLDEYSSGNRGIDQVDGNSPSSSHMGDSPLKFYKHVDEGISSDWEQEPFIRTFQEPCTGTRYECTICNTFLNSVGQVRSHIRGAKHLKVKGTLDVTKLHEFSSGNRRIYQVDGNSASSSHMGDSPSKFNKHIDEVISSDWEQEPYIIFVGKEYKCTICKTYLNSVDQVRTHIRGAKHLKAKGTLDLTKLGESSSDINQVDGNSPSSSHIADSPFKFYKHFDEFKELIDNIKVFKPNDEIVF